MRPYFQLHVLHQLHPGVRGMLYPPFPTRDELRSAIGETGGGTGVWPTFLRQAGPVSEARGASGSCGWGRG
jgi:hypothetical protein